MNMLITKKSARAEELRVLECLNLKPKHDTTADVLCVVGKPKVIAEEKWEPLATVGEALLVHNERYLACAVDGEVTDICILPSLPRCVHVVQPYVEVMTGDGVYLLRQAEDGSFVDIGLVPDFGSIAVTAEPVGTYESTIDSCKIEAVGTAMLAAYREIVEEARVAGAYVQPVIVRCKLLDSVGNVLHTTPPIAVMLDDGAQLTSAWKFGSDDGGSTVRSETVSAQGYRLRVTIDASIASEWKNLIQRLEVEATPQFHPVDFSGSARVDMGRASSTDKYIRVTLPGVERGISQTRPIAAAEVMKRAVERFDDIASTVAYINNPYIDSVDKTLTLAAPIDVADEADDLASALAKATTESVSTELSRLLIPHRFTADAVAGAGDSVVWANAKPIRFGGYNVGVYAASYESKHYTGFIRVEFVTGERVVTHISGDHAPITVGPLIVYPSAEAVSMTMAVQVDGESTMRTLSVALTPDVTGRYAMYISPTMVPVKLENGAKIAAPASIDVDISAAGSVVVTTNAIVPQAKSVSRVSGEVLSVLAARTGSSAWEYKRSRYYVFGNDGIKLLTVNSALSECAVNLLDRRCIDNKHCAVDGGNVVYALCDGGLIQLSSSSVKSIAHDVVGDRLAWIASDNEIVVGNTDDNVATHYCLQYDNSRYTSTFIARGGWCAESGKAYAVTEEGLVSLSERTAAKETSVQWQAMCVANKGKRDLPRYVKWMVKASAFTGQLKVDRAWLTSTAPTPTTISGLNVSGAIKSPIRCYLHGHNAIDMQLVIAAKVSSDFAVTYPIISNK